MGGLQVENFKLVLFLREAANRKKRVEGEEGALMALPLIKCRTCLYFLLAGPLKNGWEGGKGPGWPFTF